ncbi:MAG: hypothetical protein HN337_07515 [Deltaproteobacteria bacterium]|jgi:cell division protein FtsB|nr:hypothetical protein [Deltaproteobacteria bacterium]
MKHFLINVLARLLNVLTPARLIVLALAGFFFWFLAFGDQGIYKLRLLFDMKGNLLESRQKLNNEIDTLTRDKETLADPGKLEMVIRKELRYIKPGEIIFQDKSN